MRSRDEAPTATASVMVSLRKAESARREATLAPEQGKVALRNARTERIQAVHALAAQLNIASQLPPVPDDTADDAARARFEVALADELRRLKLEGVRLAEERQVKEERERAALFALAARARRDEEANREPDDVRAARLERERAAQAQAAHTAELERMQVEQANRRKDDERREEHHQRILRAERDAELRRRLQGRNSSAADETSSSAPAAAASPPSDDDAFMRASEQALLQIEAEERAQLPILAPAAGVSAGSEEEMSRRTSEAFAFDFQAQMQPDEAAFLFAASPVPDEQLAEERFEPAPEAPPLPTPAMLAKIMASGSPGTPDALGVLAAVTAPVPTPPRDDPSRPAILGDMLNELKRKQTLRSQSNQPVLEELLR